MACGLWAVRVGFRLYDRYRYIVYRSVRVSVR